jgi:hypothetical protein
MIKLERAALLVSALAVITAGWRVAVLQARLDRLSPNSSLPVYARAQAETVEPRLKKVEAASPGLGEIMCGIQLHFAKLHFAAEARNWDLARFERGELEEGLEKVAALRPQENGVNLSGIADAFKGTQLVALKDAIDMKDRSMFREAYRESVLMCNTCHQSTGRPFIMITIPTNPPVTNQRWEMPQ